MEDFKEEKSSKSSSFEDLSKEDFKDSAGQPDEVMDVVGNQQLLKKILLQGQDDTRPQRTSVCKVSFEGRLGGELIEKHTNFTIQLGDYEVVQGQFFLKAFTCERMHHFSTFNIIHFYV